MRGYGQFCPVAKAAEIFAEKWTPLILRELLYGSHRFSELRLGMPLISQSLLVQRLRALERAGVIERRRSDSGHGWEYHLTAAGEEFRPVVELLGAWGARWALDKLQLEDRDPGVLMWFIYRLINVQSLPKQRVVVQFDFREGRQPTWWLVLNHPEVDLCLRDPGFEVDIYVTAETQGLIQVILGRVELRQAISEGRVAVQGPRDLTRAFPDWIGVSGFARHARPTPVNTGQ